jgi:hypothetical protein
MIDEELRALEREILAAPASLELRRRHAQVLFRSGDEERGIAALDLAWRLGADELWDELRKRLQAWGRHFQDIELGYVPAGPFAMGSNELDDDSAPAHLVWLSAFYIAKEPLTWVSLQGWSGWSDRLPLNARGSSRARYLAQPVIARADIADQAVAYLESAARAEGVAGRFALPTEAQWERVFRASCLRPDGASPYGAVPAAHAPEWVADRYNPDAYSGGPRRDPLTSLADSKASKPLRAVRGVPGLPQPHFSIYREAALETGGFDVGQAPTESHFVESFNGIALRVVFVPED